jgi:hypothetical protein
MADPDPRIEALEARQKAEDQERVERRLLELKRNAIMLRVQEDAEDQEGLWKALDDVVEEAADNYLLLRVRGLEARLDAQDKEGGLPIWLSFAISVGLMFLPVTAMTNALLGALAVGRQMAMKRTANLVLKSRSDQIAALRKQSTKGDREKRRAWQRRTSRDRKAAEDLEREKKQVLNELKAAEKAVKEFYERLKPEVSNQVQDFAKSVLEAAGRVLFDVDGNRPKVVPTSSPIVAVRSSFAAQIGHRKGDEDAARRLYRGWVEALYAEATEYIELAPVLPRTDHKRREKSRTEARELLHLLYKYEFDLDDYQPYVPAPHLPAQQAPDLSDLRQLLEMMMWATTFDFSLRSPERFKILRGDRGRMGQDFEKKVELPRRLETLALPDEMWKVLLEEYRDPDTNQPFAASTRAVTLGTESKPADSDAFTKAWPEGALFGPRHRFSYFMSTILAEELDNETKRVGNEASTIARATARSTRGNAP